PVAEVEPFRPLAIAGAKVPDEAGDDVGVRTGQGLEDRARAPPAEEAAGVGEAEPRTALVGETCEVLEVAAVRDRLHSLGAERAELPADPDRDRGHGVRAAPR